jgi:hypothetical protein
MPTVEELLARRARRRQQRRRRRIIVAVVLVVAFAAALTFGMLAIKRMGEVKPAKTTAAAPTKAQQAQATVTHTATPTATASATPKQTPSPAPTPAGYVVGGPAPRPHIVKDYIDFDSQRQAEMGAYSLAHYGSSDVHLDPKVIVVHYTCGSDYSSAHQTFASDAPNMGVKPGVVSQFVIDKDGSIYQQIPLQYEGRHTVGLNYVAYGIECVQECNGNDARVVGQILRRKPQEKALVALVRWLMYRDHIQLSNVIGHGMANDSPYYKDLKGWKNDHTDWSAPQIDLLRTKIKASH